MGKLKSPTAWFIADANVLIDYAKTSPAILGLVAQHIGPVYVVADVLEEVGQLDAVQCRAIGLTVVEANLTQWGCGHKVGLILDRRQHDSVSSVPESNAQRLARLTRLWPYLGAF